jgi:hypothetical protein
VFPLCYFDPSFAEVPVAKAFLTRSVTHILYNTYYWRPVPILRREPSVPTSAGRR